MKLSQIRQSIETHGWDDGLNKSRALVKFEEDVLSNEYNETGNEIAMLKKEYIKGGGADPEFLMNLMELEKLHKKAA